MLKTNIHKKIQNKLYSNDFYTKGFIFAVLSPALIWLFVFMFYPIFLVFKKSFYNSNLAFNVDKFIGLENYQRLLTDKIFHIALKNTIFAVIYIVPPTVILSLLVAVLLNSFRDKTREFFTPIYFLPVVTSMVAISVVWQWLYDPSYGLFNYILSLAGISQQGFVNSSDQALKSISVIQVWRDVGFYAVIFLAAIRGIPKALYEAANIDGASRIQKFKYITVPMLKPTIIFVTIVSTIRAFKVFIPIKVMTNGGPGNSTMVLVLYIIRKGIENMEIGYASALSVVMFGIVMIITFIQWILSGREK